MPYEAFIFSERGTGLLAPVNADSLTDAIAETLTRYSWENSARFGIRQIVDSSDWLHAFSILRKSRAGGEHDLRPDHLCSIDLNVIAGVGNDERQLARPRGARMEKVA